MRTEATTPGRLLNAEEYAHLPEDGLPTELVRGRVIELKFPTPWLGFICGRVAVIMGGFVRKRDLGVPTINSGIITKRNPDSVRGADFSFYSFTRVPKGTFAKSGYLAVSPDLVVEVKSPDDRWKYILAKVAEYLNAGVSVVCVLDPKKTTVTVYRADEPAEECEADETLTLPEVLPGFAVQVRRFFE